MVTKVDAGITMTFELARDEIQVATPVAPVAFPQQTRAPVAYPATGRVPAQRRVRKRPVRGKRPPRRYHNHIGRTAFVLGSVTLAIGLLPYADVVSFEALGPFAALVPYVGYAAVIPGAAGILFTIASIDNLRRRVANNHVTTILGGLSSLAGIVVPWAFLVLSIVNPTGAPAEKADTGLSDFTVCLARAMTTEEVNACS